MDLFSLVAKLTLDDSAYESAIQSAEGKGKNAQLDASGDIKAEDKYSEEVGEAEKKVAEFDKKEATADIKVDTEDATKNTQTFEGVFTDAVGKMGSALTAAGIAMGVKKIAEEFAAALGAASEYADVVDKGSRELSMSTQAYQEWRYVLQASGKDISLISKGWNELTKIAADKSLENAGDEMKEAFSALNIDPSQISTTEELFSSIIHGLAAMGNTPDRAKLVNAIFGPNGKELNAMLDSGVEGIDGLIKRAHELGLIMSESDVANGTAYGDAINDMNLAVEALKQNIVAGFFPLLTEAANKIAALVAFFNGRTGLNTLAGQFKEIDSSMTEAMYTADKDEQTTLGLIDTLMSMTDETGKCKDNLDLWRQVAEKIKALCPALANQIDTVTGSINLENGALKDNAEAWFQNVRQRAVMKALQDKESAIAAMESQRIAKTVDLMAQEETAKIGRQNAIDAFYKYVQLRGDEADKNRLTMEEISSWDQDRWKAEEEAWNTKYGRFWVNDQSSPEVAALMPTWSLGMQDWKDASKKIPELTGEIAQMAADIEAAYIDLEKSQAAGQRVLDNMHYGIALPEGTTLAGWQNLQDILSLVAGRGITNEEMRGIIERGGVTPNEKLNQIDHAELDTANATVEGNVVTINGMSFRVNLADFGITGEAEGTHAKGLWDVPYDNYLANLHRDEMVLTASQARRYREGGNDSSEIAAAIRELRADMTNLQIIVGQKTFGRTVVKYGGKRLGGYLGGAEDRVAAGYGWG